ncbi:uncharacterized protein LOC112593802 [Melanaphis sacchari]|uniref:uncharacterized protein LOC112593802 n=1 Tax=Melanaphis sacchari TaxID=742174 RepID=UPI000DC1406F|nr:uncharacterized protein LOC112593802 [Melanaphis sacchari]
MGSYQLCVAVMAIASLATAQKTSYVDVSAAYPTADEFNEPKDELESEIEHHQCDEYRSKIWDKAFSNPATMGLMDVVFETNNELGADEVCSDTIRVLINFINVMATDQSAHFSTGMLGKMLAFIAREVDVTSDNFKETRQVIERIATNVEIRNYIRNLIFRSINLIKEPEMRSRLLRVTKAFESLIVPSKDEKKSTRRLRG